MSSLGVAMSGSGVYGAQRSRRATAIHCFAQDSGSRNPASKKSVAAAAVANVGVLYTPLRSLQPVDSNANQATQPRPSQTLELQPPTQAVNEYTEAVEQPMNTSQPQNGVESLQGPPQPEPTNNADGVLRADDAWEAFEARLEADLQTVAVTLVAILGIIFFWRGVWTLLDYYLGDNPLGDVCCILLGFCIIMYIRLSGLKVGSFWPSA